MAEHREVEGERVVVLLLRRRRDAVGQRDHSVAVLVGGAHGRLDAAVGEEATDDHGVYALAAQDEVEVGAGEGVEAALALDDDVRLGRGQLVDDRCPPAALHERVAVDDALEDAVRVPGQLGVPGGEGDRRVHDRDAGGARPVDERNGVGEHPGLLHDPLDCAVEDSALGRELVLVLDEQQRGLGGVEGERFGHGGAPGVGNVAPIQRPRPVAIKGAEVNVPDQTTQAALDALVGPVDVLHDLPEEAAGAQEVRQGPLVVGAREPDLAALGGVQLGVVPAQRPPGGSGTALG